MGRRADILWLLVVGAATSAWCVAAAGELGATFDEPFYLHAGLESWRTGSNKPLMSAGCMPLPVDAHSLPIYLWERSRGEPFHAYKDIATLLPVARAANLPFWWLFLAYAMRLGRTWGGAWGGRVAVGLVGFDPNFLGHAALATTDIALAAFMLALVYHAHHGWGRGWWPRVFVPGVCFGLATLAKASGMVFGVQALFVIGIWHLARVGALAPSPGASWPAKLAHVWHAGYGWRKDTAVALGIGFTLVFAYTGSDWTVEPTFVTWAAGLPDGPVKDVLIPVSTDLRIFPNAGEALIQQIKHNMRGHGTYLLGAWYDRATWAYFPVALSMKTPLPALVLILLTLVFRPRAWNTPAGWFALLLLLFSLNCRVQIGVRFMFTLMAVSYVSAAAAVGQRRTASGKGNRADRQAAPTWQPNPPGPPSL
ncbi:MAG TPA: glycosyltransferase family 39 protein, partial [Urbifossiella sp.]|nr:glycosyltransferase family 39 protein [Urbifossiella sp.]